MGWVRLYARREEKDTTFEIITLNRMDEVGWSTNSADVDRINAFETKALRRLYWVRCEPTQNQITWC